MVIQRNRFFDSVLLKELKTNEPIGYRSYLRIDDLALYYLLNNIRFLC